MRAAPGNPYSTDRMLPPEVEANLRANLGLDKPMHERFFQMMGQYLRFDFGTSYFRDQKVMDLVLEKMNLHDDILTAHRAAASDVAASDPAVGVRPEVPLQLHQAPDLSAVNLT